MGISAVSPYICATVWAMTMNLLKPIGVVSLTAGLSDAALTAPIRNTYGKVRSISGHVLTLESSGRDMIFIVDDNTQVQARGAGRATRTAGASVPVTNLVHGGDVARVEYRELNGPCGQWKFRSQVGIPLRRDKSRSQERQERIV